MNCEIFRENLSAYLDGELSAEDSRALEAHLETCADCRRELELMRLFSESVEDDLAEVPQELHNNIMSAVRKEKRRKFFKFVPAMVGTLAACLVIAVGVRGFVGGGSEESAPNSDMLAARTMLAPASGVSTDETTGIATASLEEAGAETEIMLTSLTDANEPATFGYDADESAEKVVVTEDTAAEDSPQQHSAIAGAESASPTATDETAWDEPTTFGELLGDPYIMSPLSSRAVAISGLRIGCEEYAIGEPETTELISEKLDELNSFDLEKIDYTPDVGTEPNWSISVLYGDGLEISVYDGYLKAGDDWYKTTPKIE